MARLPNFLVIIRSEKLSGKGQGRGCLGVRKKERFVLGKRTFRSQKSKHFVLRIIIRGTVLHQASFFRKELFDENRYDESYKIVSDWKFYIQTLIFNNATFRNIRSIVCRFVPGGVSETDAGTRDMERKRVYKELFPDRMMKDYIRLEKVESPLLELIPELNKTAGLHQMAYKLVCALLWVHGKIKRVRVK